jgi:hypothetical protein
VFVFFKTCQPANLTHSIFSSHGTIQSGISKTDWILDTGATNHMVYSTSFFTTLRSVINTYVKLPNVPSALVTHIGTVRISNSLFLTDVQCVTSFAFNLISISMLTQSLNCCFIFISNLYSVQELLLWKTIGVGKKRAGLYFLQTPAIQLPNLPNLYRCLLHTHTQKKKKKKKSLLWMLNLS